MQHNVQWCMMCMKCWQLWTFLCISPGWGHSLVGHPWISTSFVGTGYVLGAHQWIQLWHQLGVLHLGLGPAGEPILWILISGSQVESGTSYNWKFTRAWIWLRGWWISIQMCKNPHTATNTSLCGNMESQTWKTLPWSLYACIHGQLNTLKWCEISIFFNKKHTEFLLHA